jgi:hypothetical protein
VIEEQSHSDHLIAKYGHNKTGSFVLRPMNLDQLHQKARELVAAPWPPPEFDRQVAIEVYGPCWWCGNGPRWPRMVEPEPDAFALGLFCVDCGREA